MAAESQFDFEGDGDYVQRRRHKSIFDTRDWVRDSILTSKREHERGKIPLEVFQSDARSAVEMYIIEIEQMANSIDAKDVLDEYFIHTVHVEPPEKLLRFFEDDSYTVRSAKPVPEPAEDGEIRGLWGYLTAPAVFSNEWSIDVDVPHKGPQTVTAENTTRMPVDASIDAFRYVNSFLERAGLDLEPKLEEYRGEEGPGI